ncbi:MAG: hypothetical protein QM754_03805 [Tepidisphaeraceae bacterium]
MPPLIQPNWHIAVVHFPIALIVVGTLVELFSFLGWRGSGFRRAGRWMLLIGAVLAVPTTFSGMYAWSELIPRNGMAELRETNPALAQAMTTHIWLNAIATAAAMFLVVVWIALSDRSRDRLNLLFKLSLIAVSGLILLGAHSGGDSVYGHGLGVDTKRTPSTLPTLEEARQLQTWESLLPTWQSHVTLAGFAMAIACIALGLAIRTTHAGLEPPVTTDHAGRIAAAFSPAAIDDPTLPPEGPIALSRNYTPPLRATRFWLLAFLLLAGTAVLGLWSLSSTGGFDWTYDNFHNYIVNPPVDDGPKLTRRLAHTVVGTVLIADTLLLAIVARIAPRQSVLLLVIAVPLVLALAAQIWLGVLLTFDGPAGFVTRFNG